MQCIFYTIQFFIKFACGYIFIWILKNVFPRKNICLCIVQQESNCHKLKQIKIVIFFYYWSSILGLPITRPVTSVTDYKLTSFSHIFHEFFCLFICRILPYILVLKYQLLHCVHWFSLKLLFDVRLRHFLSDLLLGTMPAIPS